VTTGPDADLMASPDEVAPAIETWYAGARRDLPWRRRLGRGSDDPGWAVLVAETMLQQTQVARVIDRYETFLARFPGPAALAAASEDEVLAAWQGLGYYRRARLLHAAARVIAERHRGRVPDDPDALLDLPGIGPYTAGAVASIAFGRRAPIVDGNVLRLVMRLRALEGTPTSSRVQRLVRETATELVAAADAPADLNQGLMELGSLVCAPRGPKCDICPVSFSCRARHENAQDRIPAPKTPAPKRDLHAISLVVHDPDRDAVVLEQRPTSGLWARLWQAPTIERVDRPPTRHQIDALVAEVLGKDAGACRTADRLTHETSHRRVALRILVPRPDMVPPANPRRGRWIPRSAWSRHGMGNAQRRVLAAGGIEEFDAGGLPRTGRRPGPSSPADD